MGLLSFAHSYWEAAVVLQKTPREAVHKDSPRDYLYYHAIELYLKAYLRLKGFNVVQLRKIGHGIHKLHEAAIKNGLSYVSEDAAVIALIGENYLASRYISTGFFQRPLPEALWGICYVLHDEIEPQVNEASNITRKRPIPYLEDDSD
jgi:HEPN domain-containing protein